MTNLPTEADAEYFRSGNGMLTQTWGPPLWHVLHAISFNYPVHPTRTQRKQYARFIDALQHVLPCGHCRNNLADNVACAKGEKNIYANREAFSQFMYRLHDTVNVALGKPKHSNNYNTVRMQYESLRARCTATATPPERAGERGCTHPALRNVKSKCVLRIVPAHTRTATFRISKHCHNRNNAKATNRGHGSSASL